MKGSTSTFRIAGRDVLTLAVIAGGVLVGVLIAWALVDWASVTTDAKCVFDGATTPSDCTISEPAGARSFVAALAAVLLGATVAAAAQYVVEVSTEAELHVSPISTVPPPTAPPPAPPVRELPAGGAHDGAPSIILRCIELLDRRDPATAPDPLTRQQLEGALAEVGCSSFDPTGRAFDPRSHRAVDRIGTDDPTLANMIAITERLGWCRRDQILRPADVVVSVVLDE